MFDFAFRVLHREWKGYKLQLNSQGGLVGLEKVAEKARRGLTRVFKTSSSLWQTPQPGTAT